MHTMRSFRTALWLFLAALMLFTPAVSHAQIAVSITVAPPALPVYVQPVLPGEGYLWTPGYWAWSDDDGDYYFVPGTWVEAPTPGFLWTPGYWGWNNGVYAWNGGYWGPHIGFYGGVNYGFGYVGEGYEGGRWEGGHFFYNRSVNNVNVTVIHNVYNKTVINNYSSTTRASFNGPGGVSRKATAQEETFAHEQHTPPTSVQVSHREMAAKDRSQFASVNHGKPAVAATAKPGDFKAGVVPAKAAAPYKGATGKGAANAGGGKATGGAAAGKTNTPVRSAAATNEHSGAKPASNAGATSERKAGGSAEKPAARENAAPTAAPKSESTPHTATHDTAAKPAREAAPKAQPAPKPQPAHESAPKAQPQHEAAPKPQHEAAPKPQPQHESAPKPQPQHEAAPKPAPAQHEPANKPEEKPKR